MRNILGRCSSTRSPCSANTSRQTHVFPGAQGEELLLQGVVDCCFDTPEGLVIVDFKTDRVRLGQEPERAEVYRPQLEAYSRALSRVLERNISERILYFFATGQEISL